MKSSHQSETLNIRKYSSALLIGTCLLLLSVLLFHTDASAASAKVRWYVKQSSNYSVDTKQSMFYLLYSSDGKLIVIDGGWSSNEANVRKEIRKRGGRVDLWIITHPHPDHAGAFNAIFSKPDGIRIKKVFAPNINAGIYKKNMQPWDEYKVFKKFTALTKGNSKLTYIKDGMSYKYRGLNFRFYNSYYSGMVRQTKDICNDSSLVFKVSTTEKSMLFCGDINAKTGSRLLKKYGSKLCADYLQMPHHANNIGRNTFFEAVDPIEAFADAPVWLLETKAVQYNIRYLRSRGCLVYTPRSKGNVIRLS